MFFGSFFGRWRSSICFLKFATIKHGTPNLLIALIVWSTSPLSLHHLLLGRQKTVLNVNRIYTQIVDDELTAYETLWHDRCHRHLLRGTTRQWAKIHLMLVAVALTDGCPYLHNICASCCLVTIAHLLHAEKLLQPTDFFFFVGHTWLQG